MDGWREEGGRRVWPLFLKYDLVQRRPVRKPTKYKIASTVSFSRWTRIQRNGQCLTRPPANKSPDPTRAWPTRILYHTWRKKCQGCSHWKERRTKRETERIPQPPTPIYLELPPWVVSETPQSQRIEHHVEVYKPHYSECYFECCFECTLVL